MIKLGIERLFIQGRVWLKQAYFKIEEIPATTFTSEPGTQPTTPAENEIYLYAKESATSDVSRLWFKDDAGIEHELPGTDAVAAVDADYLVKTAHAGLSSERVVTDTATVAWDWATGGQAKANVPNSSITLAKIANASANSKLLGSGAAGAGSPYAELTLGTNLSMSGTTLNASGGSGSTDFLVVQVFS